MKEITINRTRCKQCEICIAFCPKKVLVPDEDKTPVAEHADVCIGCKLCEMRCPEMAVEVKG